MNRTEGMTDTGAAREGDTPTLAAGYRRFVTRRTAWLVILATALVTTVVVNIMTGPAGLSLAQVANGFLHPDALEPGLYVILWDVRLPFALMAVAVGACLGLAGAEMQTVLNNPLASPQTLGVMYAATLGAALAIVLNLSAPLGIPENYVVPVCAFAAVSYTHLTLPTKA